MSIDQDFRESETYERLEPYLDKDGLIAGYRIEGLVSQDPWGHSSFEAVAPDGGRVALKLLGERSDQTWRFTRRLQRLLRLRASVDHPHLLPILDWGETSGRFYVATPLHRVPTLADLLKAAPLKATGALRLLAQVADALEAALAQGLVHRDLKPDRVLVTADRGGHVLLGDFGVGDPEWSTGMLDQPGSIPYLPPEKVRGEPLTRESNVYSLACILVECLTGRPPYFSEHAGVVAYAHVAEPPPLLSQDYPGLPPAFDDVLAEAMAKDPGERLASPRQFVDAAAGTLGWAVPRSGPGTQRGARDAPATGGRLEGPVYGTRGVLAVAVAATVGFGALGYVVGHADRDTTETRPKPSAQRAQPPSLQATEDALRRLDARRVALRRSLAAASTPDAQRSHALRLAAAYGEAVRSSPAAAGPGSARLRSSLRAAERAYLQLGAAARARSPRRYATAARAVKRSEREVNQAMRRLAPG